MNKPNNMKGGRQRGRNGGKPRPHHQQGGPRNFDGNNNNMGRMRGNAQQLMEKFLAMGRDASSQGDRVAAENYFQHADHYYRVLNARFEQQGNNNGGQQNGNNGGRRFDQQGGDRFEGDGQPQFNNYNQQNGQPSGGQGDSPQPMQPDSDIGLPPQILAAAQPSPSVQPPVQNNGVPAQGGDQSGRPRQPSRRRERGGEDDVDGNTKPGFAANAGE